MYVYMCMYVYSYIWHTIIKYTGCGGASIYGKEFEDEISPDLKHTGMYADDYDYYITNDYITNDYVIVDYVIISSIDRVFVIE